MPKIMDINGMAGDAAMIGAALSGGSFEEVLKGPVLEEIRGGIRDNFASQSGPAGEAWPARKVKGDGHALLQDTGALMRAATGTGPGKVLDVTPRTLSTGVDKSEQLGGIPGAGVHQFGYRNIPARPYLGASEERLDKVEELIADRGLEMIDGG
jgi:phage gpG-like protein